MVHGCLFLCSDPAQRKWRRNVATLACGFGGKFSLTFDHIILYLTPQQFSGYKSFFFRSLTHLVDMGDLVETSVRAFATAVGNVLTWDI